MTRAPRDRGRSLVRALRLARRLEGLRVIPPLPDLAAEFRVHPRTIRRDLRALACAGWSLPRYRTDRRWGWARRGVAG